MDDKRIINALFLNEEDGYKMMIDKYSTYVASIVFNMTRDIITNTEMEEIVAEVFFKVWMKRDELKGDSIKGFIGQIARNSSIDVLRKNGSTPISLDDDIISIQTDDSVEKHIEDAELINLLNGAVRNLKEPDREIFIRHYYFGEKLKDIGEYLNINLSTVKTKLRRSRDLIKSTLNERWYKYEEK